MNKCIYLICILFPIALAFGQSNSLSLSLNAAIALGLKNNPEIKAAIAKTNAVKGRFLSAISPAAAEFSITNDYIPAGANLNSYGEKTVGISQSIDFPVNYYIRGSKVSIEKKIAANEYALTKLSVAAAIKKTYFNVLAVQAQVSLAQENSVIANEFLQKAGIRYSVGEGSNLERLTAQVSNTEAMNVVEIQNNRLVAAFAELNAALGFGKADGCRCLLTDTLAYTPLSITLGQITDDADTAHPYLKICMLRAELYSADKSIAWWTLVPNFSVGYYSKQVRGDTKNYYGVSFGMSIPLWFMFDQRGKIHEATAQTSIAQAELQTARNTVYAKIQSAFVEFKNEEKHIRLYQNDILPQAEEMFRIAAKSYEAGEITYIEYLQAQQTLKNSRGNYSTALHSYNLSIVTLEEALGKTVLY
jgi:outer membrane protein TolC